MGTVTFLMPFNYIQDEISINLKAIFPQIKKKKFGGFPYDHPTHACLKNINRQQIQRDSNLHLSLYYIYY